MAPPVAGYIAWWDASLITATPDNTALASWPAAAGGSAYNLVQATGASKPTYYSSTAGQLVNGLPVVRFNGAQSMATSPVAATVNQPFTVVVIARTAAPATTACLYDKNVTGASQTTLYVLSSLFQLYAGTLLAGPASDSALHFFAGVYNGASSSLTIDAATTSGAAGAAVMAPIMVGQQATGGTGWNGPICEIILYGSALSPANIASLQAYAAAKWGTPSSAVTATAAVALGPLTLTASGTATTVINGTAAMALGPLTLAAAAGAGAITGCIRRAWLTLGARTVLLEDPTAGYFCSGLDLGHPTPRDVLTNRPDQNGADDRTQYFGIRTINIQIEALSGAGARIDQVAANFAPFVDPGARPVLHYRLDRDTNPERVMTVRAAGFTWPIVGAYQRSMQLQFVAADPVARNPVATTATATPAAAASIFSPGDLPARPLFRITGPITAPAVTLTPSSGPVWTLAFLATFAIGAGHFVDVDTAARTVLLDADPAKPRLASMDWTQSSWQWIPPAPTSATMSLAGTATTGATQVLASWQDGYLT